LIQDETVIDYDPDTRTFTVTGAYFNNFQNFMSSFKVQVTGLTNPNNYNLNYFTFATYDDMFNEFPIDQDEISITPIGVLEFSKAKKRNFSRVNYILDFTADRDIPADALFEVSLSGDLIIPE